MGVIPESACVRFSLRVAAIRRSAQQMGRPIDITRLEHSATALRELAAKTHDGAVVRRLLAIALILEGHSREEAARRNGMDRQILRDWVHRYNADGVAGLRSRWGPGRPPALNKTQMEELRSLVLEGPDLARNGVVRWRCADLRAEIAARWSVTVSEGTVGRLLHRLRMTRLQPRPYHPKKDAVVQETFKMGAGWLASPDGARQPP
jgi:transposase